jgi:predicted component of type VI protein secretion system
MAKLIISFKGAPVAEHELHQGEMVIGRKDECDIQIDSLAVSGRHAKVVTTADASVLEDLNSTNGTFVNNQKVSTYPLKNGDIAQIGKHTITFVTGLVSAAEEDEDDFEKTVVLGAGAMPGVQAPPPAAPAPTPRAAAAPAPSAPAGGAMVGGLQMLNGPRVGQTFDLAKSLTNVGQKGQCAAVISRRGGSYHLAHMDGPNPPLVNGAKLGEQAQKLDDGDIVDIGNIKMQFYLKAKA